ncbi:MAG: DUF4115 domain-containing protein [Desulfovibrio sp.]|nr:DUF4115 domain-containing protein [Desulfovibrio sp.]
MPTPFQELGAVIRAQRESMGLSVEDVSARIKISTRILTSIEEGSSVGLPHAVYTKNFIRSFGTMVGCEPAELNARLEEIFPRASFDEATHEPVFSKNATTAYPGTVRRLIVFCVLLVFLGGLAGVCWYIGVHYGTQIIEMVRKPFSAFTDEAREQPDQPSGVTGSGTEGAARSGEAVPGDGVKPDPSRQVAMPVLPPPRVDLPGSAANDTPIPASPAVLPGAGAPAPETGSVESRVSQGDAPGNGGRTNATTASDATGVKNQILIRSRAACWLIARADGGEGREYTLKSGESFVLTYRKNMEITLGNAGGVDIEHNGRKIASSGRQGQRVVLRFPQQP